MKLVRLYADDHGETHLTPVDLPARAVGDGPRRVGFGDVPTTTLTIGQLLERKPDTGRHCAPRRQLVVVLRGALEVSTTAGEVERFGPGDCLLADDVSGKGHITLDVGLEALATLTVGITDAWPLLDA